MVEGPVQEVSPVEADLYWVTRSRLSQLGAWASRQSRPLANRDQLISDVTAYETKYRGSTVPRPEYWSGFRVIPHRIEFWTGRSFRLNDRLVYEKTGRGWTVQRLVPLIARVCMAALGRPLPARRIVSLEFGGWKPPLLAATL